MTRLEVLAAIAGVAAGSAIAYALLRWAPR